MGFDWPLNDKFALNNMQHIHLIKFGKDILKTKKFRVIEALAKRKWKEASWEDNCGTKSSSGNKRGRAKNSKDQGQSHPPEV